MNLSLILKGVGTLFPIIFPKQEFKPKRLVGVLLTLVVVIGAVKLVGTEDLVQAIEITEDIIEVSEEG